MCLSFMVRNPFVPLLALFFFFYIACSAYTVQCTFQSVAGCQDNVKSMHMYTCVIRLKRSNGNLEENSEKIVALVNRSYRGSGGTTLICKKQVSFPKYPSMLCILVHFGYDSITTVPF